MVFLRNIDNLYITFPKSRNIFSFIIIIIVVEVTLIPSREINTMIDIIGF